MNSVAGRQAAVNAVTTDWIPLTEEIYSGVRLLQNRGELSELPVLVATTSGYIPALIRTGARLFGGVVAKADLHRAADGKASDRDIHLSLLYLPQGIADQAIAAMERQDYLNDKHAQTNAWLVDHGLRVRISRGGLRGHHHAAGRAS
jgi:hypothetical protein